MKVQSTLITVYGCDEKLVRDRDYLENFSRDLCKVIRMKPFGQPLIERFGQGRLKGYSLVQLIETSNITVHLDEPGNKAFVDICSCRPFISEKAADFSKKYFKGKGYRLKEFERG
jgi:S-adenosylmethionine/arginine decarboxylase-like enzyme